MLKREMTGYGNSSTGNFSLVRPLIPRLLLFSFPFFRVLSDAVVNETEVYGKQDKLVKQGKQTALNEEFRQLVREKFKLSESFRQ